MLKKILAGLGALAAVALVTALVLRAQTLPAEPSEDALLAQIDPKQSTDYSLLQANLVAARTLYFVGEPLWVEFQLLNTSDKPVLVKVPFEGAPAALADKPLAQYKAAGLPMEHIFSRTPAADASAGRRALVIHAYNDPVTEYDNDVVYKSPGPVEPILLRPNGMVGRRLDLARHYPTLAKPGRYLVQWRPYSDAKRSLTVELRIMAEERAVIETSMGNMTVNLFYDKAPNHVENFLDLARRKFYDGTLFHRVIEDFMVQGGDPLTADATRTEEWGTGRGPRTLKQEFNDTVHVPGILSTARGPDVNSASCQFFIVTGNAPHLNNQYTAFGRVADEESLKVAMKISKVRRDERDRPLQAVTVKSIRVEPAARTTQPATGADR